MSAEWAWTMTLKPVESMNVQSLRSMRTHLIPSSIAESRGSRSSGAVAWSSSPARLNAQMPSSSSSASTVNGALTSVSVKRRPPRRILLPAGAGSVGSLARVVLAAGLLLPVSQRLLVGRRVAERPMGLSRVAFVRSLLGGGLGRRMRGAFVLLGFVFAHRGQTRRVREGGPNMSTSAITVEIEQPPESPTAPQVPVEEPEPTPDPVTEPEPDPVDNPAPP